MSVLKLTHLSGLVTIQVSKLYKTLENYQAILWCLPNGVTNCVVYFVSLSYICMSTWINMKHSPVSPQLSQLSGKVPFRRFGSLL